jgi:hypothetical protein
MPVTFATRKATNLMLSAWLILKKKSYYAVAAALPSGMSNMNTLEPLFTLNDTVETDPAITHWWAEKPADLSKIAFQCFQVMKSLGKDVREVLHDGMPTACVGKYPFAYVNAFKSHVNIGFFYGAFLTDKEAILQGNGKRMRHIKLKPGELLFENSVYPLIFIAYADLKHRISLLDD